MRFSFISLLVTFESSQFENRRTSPCFPSFPCSTCSPCYPCSPNLLHVLQSGFAGFNEFCSPVPNTRIHFISIQLTLVVHQNPLVIFFRSGNLEQFMIYCISHKIDVTFNTIGTGSPNDRGTFSLPHINWCLILQVAGSCSSNWLPCIQLVILNQLVLHSNSSNTQYAETASFIIII